MTSLASWSGPDRAPGPLVAQLHVVPTEEGMSLSGEVDLATWATLRRALSGVADGKKSRDIVLDVSGLSFIDGHGMRLIAQAARELGYGSRLVLKGAPPTLLRVAEILGLDGEPNLVIEGSDGADA